MSTQPITHTENSRRTIVDRFIGATRLLEIVAERKCRLNESLVVSVEYGRMWSDIRRIELNETDPNINGKKFAQLPNAFASVHSVPYFAILVG